MSKTILNITPTTMISNQCTDVILNSNDRTSMNTINVNGGRQNQRDREKGERENKEDDVERTRQINENTHSLTSLTTEQYNYPINTNSMTNYFSSYPSINRYYTSPYPSRHYLDNCDFDIISEEIIEIIDLDHYPTLVERWGDDTKPIIKQQGEYQIEDYVEFEEIEPTIIEEISYEIIYSGEQIQSTKEIHHSRSESRNFRKIRKRRTKRKRSIHATHNPLSSSIHTSNNDLTIEKKLLRNLKPDEQKKQEYDNKIQKDINQYHVPSNDISSRTKSSINENQTKLQTTVLEVNQNLPDAQATEQIQSESLIKLIHQIHTLVSKTDEKQSDSDILSITNDVEETTVPSNSPVTLTNILLPATEIKTETRYIADETDKKSITKLSDEVDKQRENTTIRPIRLSQHTYADKNESITINYVNETAKTIIPDEQQQPLLSSKNKADENKERSPDYLVDVVRQIRTMSSTNNLSTDDYTEKSTKDTEVIPLPTDINAQTTEEISSKNFFVPETPTSSETDFNDLYEHRFFPFTTMEEALSQFTPSDNEKSTTSDLTKMYYELQEQRYIQPTLNEIQTKEKHVNVNNHIDITSFSIVSNLPTKEYRQVFGVPDEIVNTVDDLTYKVDQELKAIASNEKSQIIETSDDRQSIISTDQEEIKNEAVPSITSKVELDFRYTSLFDRINTLIKPLLDLPLSNVTDIDSNISINADASSKKDVATVEDNIDNTNQDIMPIQEQLIEISKPSINSNYPWYSNQYKVAATEFDRLSTIQPSSPVEQTKLSSETLQIINDDYPWYSSHYTIVDAEARFARLYQQIPTSNTHDNVTSFVTNAISNLTSLLPISESTKEDTVLNGPTISDDKDQSSVLANESMIISIPTPRIESKTVDDKQSSSTTNEENRSIFDFVAETITGVKETISNLVSHDEQIITEKSPDDIQPSENLDNDKDAAIVSIQKQVNQSSERLVTSSYPWYSSQYKVSATEHDRLSTTDQSSNIPHEQQGDIEKKSSGQQLQIINDDYPWYSNHYNIVDAEARFARLYKQITNSSSLITNAVSSFTDGFSTSESIKDQSSVVISDIIVSSTPSEETETKENNDQPQSSLSELVDTMKNLLPSQLLSNTPTETSSESNEQQHGVFDFITETILNLVSHEENSATPESPSKCLDKLTVDVHESDNLKNNIDQQTNADLIQEQVLQRPKHSNTSNYPWHASQPLQVIHDDHLWYSNHYTIVDAEAKLAQLNKQSLPPPLVEVSSELHSEQNDDTDGFRVVQHRKRIPSSSTTHEKTVSSTISTPKSVISPDIDLEPVILHGNPDIPIHISSTVPPTNGVVTKKKHKKRKTDKEEMILFDAPEPTSSHVTKPRTDTTQSPTEEHHHQENIEIGNSAVVDQTPETLSTIVISDTQELKQTDEKSEESTSSNISQLLYIPLMPLPSIVVEVYNEQNDDTDGFRVIQHRKRIPSSSTTHEKTVSSTITTSKSILSCDIDLAPVILHGNPNISIPISSIVPQTTGAISKKKQKKRKTDKQEIILFDAPEPTSSDVIKPRTDTIQSSTEEQRHQKNIQTDSSILVDQAPETLSTTVISDTENLQQLDEKSEELTSSNTSELVFTPVVALPPTVDEVPSELHNEQNEDTDGFRVVQHRKRISSSSTITHEKTVSSSIVTSKSVFSADIDLEPVILHGNPEISIPISSIVPQTTGVVSKKKQKRRKTNKEEMILFDAPEPSSGIIETRTDTTQSHTEEQQHQKNIQTDSSTLVDQAPETLSTTVISDTENLQQLDEKSEELTSSNTSELVFTPVIALPPTVDEVSSELHSEQNEDTDGFRVVQHRKRIPSSSTTHEKPVSSSIVTSKSVLSSDIDLEPVILHGNPDIPIFVKPIVPQTTSAISKKKQKKRKTDKQEMILFDAPEPTSDITETRTDTTQSHTKKQQHQEHIEIDDSAVTDQTSKYELEQLHSSPVGVSHNETAEISPTSIVSDTEELKQLDAKAEELTSSDTSQLVSTPVMPLPSTVGKVSSEVNNEQNDETDGFRVVQHRKRIPSSSTTNEKPASSSIVTSKSVLSSDIDLEPVILHGNPNIPVSVTPIIPQTTGAVTKKKHKKRNKDKQEMILFDAPEPTSPDVIKPRTDTTQSPTEEQQHQNNIQIHNSVLVDQTPETLSTMVISNTEELKESDEKSEESTNKVPVTQSLPSTTKTIRKESIASSKEEDNEGFQLVQYRKRILSAPKSECTPSSTPTSKEIPSPDINQKTSVILVDQMLPKSNTTDIQSSTSQKKGNTNKKHKKEINSSSVIDSPKVTQEASLQSHIPSSSSVIEDSHVQPNSALLPIIKPTPVRTKPTTPVEEEEDNEGFQVVTYRKRVTSAPKSVNTPPLSSAIKKKYEQNNSRNIGHKSVVLHGRHGSASPSVSRKTGNTKTSSNHIKEVRSKQTSLINTPPRSASAETHNITSTGVENNLSTSKNIKQQTYQPSSKKESPISTKVEIPDMVPLTAVIEKSKIISEEQNLSSTIDEKSTGTYVNNELSFPSTTAPEIIIPETTKSKEPKIIKKNTRSLLITNLDSFPLSVEETIDQITNHFSNSGEATLINTTYETLTPETSESIDQIDDTQSPAQSINSAASTTIAVEEISLSSNEQPGEVNDFSIAKPVRSTSISQAPSTTSIEPTTNTEDQHVETTSSKKTTKRRKKKSHAKEKPSDDDQTSTSLTNTVVTEPITSTTIETIVNQSYRPSPTTSTITSDEMNNKLDLFLPEYIRQQINTHSSTTSSSSETIQKKKPRLKMLNKDHEAKSLLTNEFDTIQNIHSNENSINTSPKPTIDNILSRGFYHWLQESQAISQQKDNLTNIMQSIVIQPITTNDADDEDEDSWNTSKVNKSTYMIGIRPEKRIHITNAYSINHPESISKPSWLIAQSNNDTFQDHSEKSNSDNEDDTPKTQTYLNSNHQQHQQTNFTTNNIQQCLTKDFSHQPSMHFDDWAYFLQDKTSYHIGDDLPTSLECFYTETYDEDTLLSDVIPIHHSLKTERQRYGDFTTSNNDEYITKCPLYKSKPSEYFQNCRKNERISLSYQSDDEIFISHSNDGLSRIVRP